MSEQPTICPSVEELLGFVKKQLDADSRQRVELHLLDCRSCMQQWRDMRQFILEPPSSRIGIGQIMSRPRILALAATVLFAFTLGIGSSRYLFDGKRSDFTPVQVSTLHEMLPQSLQFRGADDPSSGIQALPAEPLTLLLNTTKAIPGECELRIRNDIGGIVYEQHVRNAVVPLCLTIPAGTLPSGDYRIELTDSQKTILEFYILRLDVLELDQE